MKIKIVMNKGGSGSGNFGHSGRPGLVGGSGDEENATAPVKGQFVDQTEGGKYSNIRWLTSSGSHWYGDPSFRTETKILQMGKKMYHAEVTRMRTKGGRDFYKAMVGKYEFAGFHTEKFYGSNAHSKAIKYCEDWFESLQAGKGVK